MTQLMFGCFPPSPLSNNMYHLLRVGVIAVNGNSNGHSLVQDKLENPFDSADLDMDLANLGVQEVDDEDYDDD